MGGAFSKPARNQKHIKNVQFSSDHYFPDPPTINPKTHSTTLADFISPMQKARDMIFKLVKAPSNPHQHMKTLALVRTVCAIIMTTKNNERIATITAISAQDKKER